MKTKHVLILALAGIAIFYLLRSMKEFDASNYLQKIEDLEKKVDSLHSENETLNTAVLKLEGKLAQYDKQVDSLEQNIVIIKKKTDEKLRNVNNLTLSELQSFFTERYGTSSSTTGTNSSTSGERPDNR